MNARVKTLKLVKSQIIRAGHLELINIRSGQLVRLASFVRSNGERTWLIDGGLLRRKLDGADGLLDGGREGVPGRGDADGGISLDAQAAGTDIGVPIGEDGNGEVGELRGDAVAGVVGLDEVGGCAWKEG